MHQDIKIIYSISAALADQLQGYYFQSAYSASRDELVMVFERGQSVFTINLITRWQQVFLIFGTRQPVKISNARAIFNSLAGQPVLSLMQHGKNRSFQLNFPGDAVLFFKMYGSLTNIILYHSGNPVEMFRESIKNDHAFLKETGDVSGDHEGSSGMKYAVIRQSDMEVKSNPYSFVVLEKEEIPGTVFTSDNVLEALTRFSACNLKALEFRDLKKRVLKDLDKRKQHTIRILNACKEAMENLDQEIPPEEIGHIIMANLEGIKPAMEKISLYDFYRDQQITIRLKKDLNAQENAAWYYRKSKRRHRQVTDITLRTSKSEQELKTLERLIAKAETADDMKSLNPFIKSEMSRKKDLVPFKVFEKDGYLIWVGKNAANNDLLTTRYAGKNDLWLHAKDCSGSHVIIKQREGKAFPKHLIGYAAGIAAWFSKMKGSIWVEVVFTLKKFVRKPKGAEPGAVIVEKEEMILVKPFIPGIESQDEPKGKPWTLLPQRSVVSPS